MVSPCTPPVSSSTCSGGQQGRQQDKAAGQSSRTSSTTGSTTSRAAGEGHRVGIWRSVKACQRCWRCGRVVAPACTIARFAAQPASLPASPAG